MSTQDEVNYYIDIEGYNIAGDVVETLRFGTEDLTTLPTDIPANTIYTSRVIQPGNFQSYIFGQSRLSGRPSIGNGEVKLNNIDGGLDYLDNYAFGGRNLNVYRVVDDNYSAKTLWFSGKIESALVNYENVILRVRDKTYSLNFEAQKNKYLGNNVLPNGVEGTPDDIKDTEKPLWYGHCRNVSPVAVNTSKLIYQCHDGAMESVDDVYDGQTPYTFVSDVADNATLQGLVVSAGTYSTCLSEGLVRLGTKPQKALTVNGRGDNSGGYIDRGGAIVKRLVETKTELTVADIDVTSFADFDVNYNYEVGIFIKGSEKVIDMVSELLGPLNHFYFTREGLMKLDIFSSATGLPVVTITDDEMIKEGITVKRTANNDETKGVPAYNVNYKWGKNYTIQKENDVYGVVTEDVIAFTSLEYRTTSSTDNAVKTAYPLSPEITVESLLYNQADADIDAVRVIDLYKTKNNFYTVKIESQYVAGLNLDDTVAMIINRFGLDAGGLLKVTGISENAGKSITTLELYG